MPVRVLQDKIELIPLDKLETWREGNVRKTNVFVDIEDLAKNIQENGLLVPLLVVRKPKPDDDKFWVISGQRRLEACRFVNYTPVDCIELTKMTEEEAMLLSLSENLYRTDMTPDDKSAAVDILYKKFGSMTEVAKKLGVSLATARTYLKYRQVPQPLKDLVSERKINPGQAVSIYVKFPEEERQVRIAQYLAKKPPTRKTKTFRAIKQAKPTDDVREIHRVEQKLVKQKRYEILLEPNTAEPIEKAAVAGMTNAEAIIVDILEKWVEDRVRKGLPIVE